MATEMLASTKTISLRSVRLYFGFLSILVVFPSSSRLHWLSAFVDSLASRRGRSRDTVTSAVSWLLKSNPIGIVGVNARLRERSISVALVVKGRAWRVDPFMPVILVFVRSLSSTLMPALSGI